MTGRYSTVAIVLVLLAFPGCSSGETDGDEQKTPSPIEQHGGTELVYEIHADQDEVPNDLAERMIEILKRRVEPMGTGLEWRPMGKDRFEVRMPTGKGGLLDPADLKRLIAKAGQLEFRIAPGLPGARPEQMPISAEDYQRYTTSLSKEGPKGAAKRNEPLRWFPIRGEPEDFRGLVVARYDAKPYILLRTEAHNTMLQWPGRSDWGIKKAYPTADHMNTPAVGFEFDQRGAKRFAALTGTNVGRFLAVLLDGEVYSCPIVREAISDRGIITGKFTFKEVEELARVLDAGALPARLNPVPVSERRIEPIRGKPGGK